MRTLPATPPPAPIPAASPQQPGTQGISGGQPKAFLRPGGFSLYQGEAVPQQQRVRRLALIFLLDHVRGWWVRVQMAGFLLPAIGFAIYVLVRANLPSAALTVPKAERMAHILQNLRWSFSIDLGFLLLFAASRLAPLITRDANAGALLLYFSRPLQRDHYLVARLAATGTLAFALLAVPQTLLLLVQMGVFGLDIGSSAGSALGIWLYLLLGTLLSSAFAAAAVALSALAAGVLVRAPSTVPLVYGGGILASLVASWVTQAAWGRDSLGRALDLHNALGGLQRLMAESSQWAQYPDFAWHIDLLGSGLWLALGAASTAILLKYLKNPPLGRGRA